MIINNDDEEYSTWNDESDWRHECWFHFLWWETILCSQKSCQQSHQYTKLKKPWQNLVLLCIILTNFLCQNQTRSCVNLQSKLSDGISFFELFDYKLLSRFLTFIKSELLALKFTLQGKVSLYNYISVREYSLRPQKDFLEWVQTIEQFTFWKVHSVIIFMYLGVNTLIHFIFIQRVLSFI